MELTEIQKRFKKFCEERGWNEFPASDVFIHLAEELGELGTHILYEDGYKKAGLGHLKENKENVEKEFAQVLNLLMQLANHFHVDLGTAWEKEINFMEKKFDKKKWSKYMKKV